MSAVIITGSDTLRELNVSHNDISDNGMALISEALQHNKLLTKLVVAECGLSVKGNVVRVQVAIKKLIKLIKHLVPYTAKLSRFSRISADHKSFPLESLAVYST